MSFFANLDTNWIYEHVSILARLLCASVCVSLCLFLPCSLMCFGLLMESRF